VSDPIAACDVFVSYASQDATIANAVVAAKPRTIRGHAGQTLGHLRKCHGDTMVTAYRIASSW
jgi:hypothetical protein